MATSDNNRSYAAAHFALELDSGGNVGLFRSIEGGSMRADVMTYQAGNTHDHWRQLGKPKFEDIKLQVGMAMSEPFYKWISDFFTGVTTRHTGSIVAADFYYKERARRNFSQAMIKELTFPKLDATDKNAAYMSIGIAVEDIVFQVGSGQKLMQADGMQNQKLWTACNFRFSLDGFSDACRRVSKVDSFTVKQDVVEYHSGGYRAPTKFPSRIDFPNLTFYVPEADAGPFYTHATNRIKNGQIPTRLNGSLETFDNDGVTLFTLQFMNADILGVTPDRSDASTEDIKQVKVELYTENMSFNYAQIQLAASPGGATT
jgi:phage tail-like protein